MKVTVSVLAGVLWSASAAFGQPSFVNWESPHVSPLDLTPDGSRLLAVNTADNRLEVFAVTRFGLDATGSVPVGLDPVTVRARTDTEAWVVNSISDTISIVDLNTMNVIATLYPGDEPADVVFGGKPQRAFVSVSQLNQVKVYDPSDLSAAPIVLDIEGEEPRALASDGATVYAAIFESGNNTTILGQDTVSSSLNPYPGNPNPPPNDGSNFDPPIDPGLPTPPPTSLILKKDNSGAWRDDNGGDWTAAVTWDLHDHDIAIIDAGSLSVTYATGMMNANMALAVKPGGGVTVVGTDAINHIRFEPNVAGIFIRVIGATVGGPGGPAAIVDLNPHLAYSAPTVPQSTRDQSIGDPRGIAWRAAGDLAFIAAMGSNNVAVVGPALERLGLIEVGQGPTGVRIDERHNRVYVLNKFDGSVSLIDAGSLTELGRVSFYDPTPQDIRLGRPFLYDTHRTSGLGQASCASCHIDTRMGQLAWDLGDPGGAVKPFNQNCNFGLGGCEDWHPMKGPMATQTLVRIIGDEPFHWRGDREDLAAFNGAFESLLGDDTQLSPAEMAQFEAFVATLTPPPNPFREFTGGLPASLGTGSPINGESLFNTVLLDGGALTCVACHTKPAGTNGMIISGTLLMESQSIKVPQLRNMYEKTGFDATSSNNNRGFGFIHDGSVDTLFNFLLFPGFTFANDQQRLDVEAFLMCFSTDTGAGVGVQATLPDAAASRQPATVQEMISLAASGAVGLIAKGVINGEQRGYFLSAADTFQSDRAGETVDAPTLLASAGPGSELTFTVVPAGSEVRIGVDRDEDAFFDADEIDAGSDPADPNSTPNNVSPADLTGPVGVPDGCVDAFDLGAMLGAWCSGVNDPNPPSPPCENCTPANLADADISGAANVPDGCVDAFDLAKLLAEWCSVAGGNPCGTCGP